MERKSFERVSQTPPLVGQGGGAGLLQVVVKGGSLIVKEGGSRLAPEHPSPGDRPAVSSNPKFVIRTDLLTAAAELVSHLLHWALVSQIGLMAKTTSSPNGQVIVGCRRTSQWSSLKKASA